MTKFDGRDAIAVHRENTIVTANMNSCYFN